MTTILHLLGNRKRIGGIVPVVEAICEHAAPSHFRHIVVMHEDFPDDGFAYPENVIRVPYLIDDGPKHGRLLRSAIRCARTDAILPFLKPGTILHSQTRGGLALGYWLHLRHKLPLVVTHQTYATHKKLYRLFKNRPNVEYVLIAQAMQEYYGLEIARNCRVISNPAAECFSAIHRSFPREPRPQVVVMIGTGTLEARKRWHLLIDALIQLPNDLQRRLCIRIFGHENDPEYSKEFQTRIEANGLTQQIQFLGVTREVKSELDNAEWFIFPSFREPLGVSVIEALASGLPVIAANSGGPAELIEHGANGYLFPEDDVDALADLLKQAATRKLPILDPTVVSRSVTNRMANAIGLEYASLYRKMSDAE